MRTNTKTATVALIGALLAGWGCKSELDDKAAAVVEDSPPSSRAAPPSVAARALALDPKTSKVEFVGAKVTADHRGRFGQPRGTVRLDDKGNIVEMEISVDTEKVEIEPEKLEQHLRGVDFFDVAKFPKAQFRLADFSASPGDAGATHKVAGDLELHGVTKRITFPATAQIGKDKVSASASFKINRKDFGIAYAGMADDLIKDEVLLEMTLEFQGSPADPS